LSYLAGRRQRRRLLLLPPVTQPVAAKHEEKQNGVSFRAGSRGDLRGASGQRRAQAANLQLPSQVSQEPVKQPQTSSINFFTTTRKPLRIRGKMR